MARTVPWSRLANGPLMARRPLSEIKRSISDARAPVPSWAFSVERVTRIELALSAWEADVLPLNYTRARPELLLRAGAPARQTDLPRHRTG
jgi:hypothetical protein